MKFFSYFKDLTKFETTLWIVSLIAVSVSFILSKSNDVLTLIASLIGVTALIFVAKGYVLGQILTVVFSLFYGIISFYFKYYGEMITYLGMTSPIAIAAVISWIKHPFEKTAEVEVKKLNNQDKIILVVLTVIVTTVFYYILKLLNNSNLFFSTVSIATSFIASYLTFMRSPGYALGYSANDIVLIILWSLASVKDPSYFPMIICFIAFLANDLYGFFNWNAMAKKQKIKEK